MVTFVVANYVKITCESLFLWKWDMPGSNNLKVCIGKYVYELVLVVMVLIPFVGFVTPIEIHNGTRLWTKCSMLNLLGIVHSFSSSTMIISWGRWSSTAFTSIKWSLFFNVVKHSSLSHHPYYAFLFPPSPLNSLHQNDFGVEILFCWFKLCWSSVNKITRGALYIMFEIHVRSWSLLKNPLYTRGYMSRYLCIQMYSVLNIYLM